jgi:hypothetical protein
VVGAAGDDGLVGVALEEIDDDLLSDAGNGDMAPSGAGPVLGDADPAGGGFVAGAMAIPGKPDGDAAMGVGVDFLARGARDMGDLGAVDQGFGGNGRGIVPSPVVASTRTAFWRVLVKGFPAPSALYRPG